MTLHCAELGKGGINDVKLMGSRQFLGHGSQWSWPKIGSRDYIQYSNLDLPVAGVGIYRVYGSDCPGAQKAGPTCLPSLFIMVCLPLAM